MGCSAMTAAHLRMSGRGGGIRTHDPLLPKQRRKSYKSTTYVVFVYAEKFLHAVLIRLSEGCVDGFLMHSIWNYCTNQQYENGARTTPRLHRAVDNAGRACEFPCPNLCCAGTCWQCRWLWGPTDDRFMSAVCGADLYHMRALPEHGCSRFKPGGDDERC